MCVTQERELRLADRRTGGEKIQHANGRGPGTAPRAVVRAVADLRGCYGAHACDSPRVVASPHAEFTARAVSTPTSIPSVGGQRRQRPAHYLWLADKTSRKLPGSKRSGSIR